MKKLTSYQKLKQESEAKIAKLTADIYKLVKQKGSIEALKVEVVWDLTFDNEARLLGGRRQYDAMNVVMVDKRISNIEYMHGSAWDCVPDSSKSTKIGIIAKTKKRCREIAKDRGLSVVREGVGDCVLITSETDMISCVFSEFIVDEGIKLSLDMIQNMSHSTVITPGISDDFKVSVYKPQGEKLTL